MSSRSDSYAVKTTVTTTDCDPVMDPIRIPVARQVLGLVACLALAYAAAAIGGMATVNAPSFYAALVQPSWAPPGSWFGPVWALLYTLMGVSLWLIWRQGKANGIALVLFLSQLLLNALWSWVFFAWQYGALALANIILLWLLIAATMVSFWHIRRLAAVLLLPYLLWVGFALALNAALLQLNPELLAG